MDVIISGLYLRAQQVPPTGAVPNTSLVALSITNPLFVCQFATQILTVIGYILELRFLIDQYLLF
jgi:hypothetical protein